MYAERGKCWPHACRVQMTKRTSGFGRGAECVQTLGERFRCFGRFLLTFFWEYHLLFLAFATLIGGEDSGFQAD